jgi:hypothetical protein
VLAAGSVPVVTDDLVDLWQGSVWRPIDWDACVIRASRAELSGLGELVRAVAPRGSAERAARRASCARAWAELSGGAGPDVHLLRARGRLEVEAAALSRAGFECAAAARLWNELRTRVARAARASQPAPLLAFPAADGDAWLAACRQRVAAYA